MFYSPARIALLGIAAWLALWILMPLTAVGHLSFTALLYMALGYAGFFGGIALVRSDVPIPQASDAPVWQRPVKLPLYWVTAGVGLLGLLLRAVDRLIFRGAQYGGDALELREQLEQSSTSIAGILGAVFLPMCMVPLMTLLASSDRKRPGLLTLAIILFLIPTAESLFQLSRSIMLLTIGMTFAMVSITQLHGRLLNRRLFIGCAIGIIAFGFVSSAIFSARIEAGSWRLIESIFESGYAELLQPNQFAWEVLVSGSDLASFSMLSALPNALYYLSGVYELGLLFDRPDPQQFAFGQILFYPFVRAFYSLVGADTGSSLDLQLYLYREGIWQTFFGPLWADFGWVGPFLMVLFGSLTQTIANGVRRGSVFLLPIYLYLSMVVFFFPVINFLTNGLGMLAITAFALIGLVPRRFTQSSESFVRERGGDIQPRAVAKA